MKMFKEKIMNKRLNKIVNKILIGRRYLTLNHNKLNITQI